jgi:hypothetical protein
MPRVADGNAPTCGIRGLFGVKNFAIMLGLTLMLALGMLWVTGRSSKSVGTLEFRDYFHADVFKASSKICMTRSAESRTKSVPIGNADTYPQFHLALLKLLEFQEGHWMVGSDRNGLQPLRRISKNSPWLVVVPNDCVLWEIVKWGRDQFHPAVKFKFISWSVSDVGNVRPEFRLLIRRENEQSYLGWRGTWNDWQLHLLRLRRGIGDRGGWGAAAWGRRDLENNGLRLRKGRCRSQNNLRALAVIHRAILVPIYKSLNESDETQNSGKPDHPVGLLLLACGVTILIGMVLGMHAADWSDSIIGDLLICIAGALVLDALISWALGYFPWDWLYVVRAACGV